jgi:phenylacetate-CoA ligase
MAYGNKITRSLFYTSPTLIKNIISSVYGFQQRIERYGKYFEEQFVFLKASQLWHNEELTEFRNKKTLEFVAAAMGNTEYYRKNNVHPPMSVKEFTESFPVLEKETVRNSLAELCSDRLSSIHHRWTHTSGTTGTSLVFPLSSNCFQREYAFRAVHYTWGGVSLNGRERIAICAGHPVAFINRQNPPFWTYDWVNNWLLLSSYHLNRKNLPYYIRELGRFRPVMLHGYPSSIYLIALAYKKYGTGKLKLRSVYTSAETLYEHQRKTIEEVFGAKVFNWYGNSEMCANIVECEKGELHLKLEHSFVEVLNDKNEPCHPGETGKLVCTGFGNEAFPLIRYDVGDIVTLSKTIRSLCGRGGILIDRVEGRTEDYIVTPDGRFVGRLDHVFKDSRNVKEAQIVQRDINSVILRIAKEDAYSSEDEREILEQLRLRLGASIAIHFEYVEVIPRTQNGKFRFIDSKLDQTELLMNLIN